VAAAPLQLGTRGSQLALWQARETAARLAAAGGPPCEIVVIRTTGDRDTESSLSEIGGKRLFVKEIEDALLDGRIDLAVHSAKDMSAALPEGLAVAAALPREDPLDAIVLPASAGELPDAPAVDAMIAALGQSPRIGTGSVRRAAQIKRLLPLARFAGLRGNLDTRLRKLDAGEFDAIVLAAAGLRRLNLAERISLCLPPDACIPAPGQGIVAVEVRAADTRTRDALRAIDDPTASAALEAERAVVLALGGGCHMPIGALATPRDPEELEVVATVVSLDGERALKAHGAGPRRDAAAIGARVGAALLAEGAAELLGTAD
jgi:hydroxymethylbilane synthase